MKKFFLILVLSILSFVAVLAVSNKVFANEKTATERLEELLEEYLGEGQYTKLTTLAYDEKEGNYHAGANQRQRRTYYDEEVNALLMGDYDGKFEHINSGYALDGADMVHYRNNAEEKTLENLFTAREENYAVLNENPVDFYDVLSDIKNKVHNMQLAKSEQFVFENGMFTYVNEKGAAIQNGSYDDGFLKQMQYFAAPMLLLNNGIKLSKVNIFEAETINDKKVLVMQLYTTEGNLVSTALVLKGLNMNAVELKFKMLSNKTTWSYPMGQEAENFEDGQYRLYRVSLEKGQALKLTNVSKWLGYDELENKDDFDVDNDKNILVKESGKYDIYIKNNGSQVYIGKSKALYELKQSTDVLAQEEDRQIEGKDHAVFEQNLEKGSIVKVAKEGELLHFYVNDEDKGTAYQTEAPGLHIFYVNNEDKVYVTAPSYVLLMDGAVQANAGIDKGNDNAKFRIELAKDAEIQIKKDEAKLHFYNNEQKDLGDKLIISKAGIYVFYVNSEDKIYFEEEIQEGAWKLLSDTLGWDYETKGELLQASGEDFVLNRYDLKAGEKFKLCNRKNWLGYNDLIDLSKALFGSDESGNIIIQDAGKYDICLHEDGTFEISKSAPIFTLKVNGTLAGQAIEKGDNQAAFEVTLAKNDTVIIEKDDVQYGKEYKAPRAGLYQIYINQYGDFWAEEPAKVYALEVNEGAPSTEYLVPKTDEKNHAEFELNLQKGDKVIITLDEAALSQPHGDEEEPITLYTAPRAGKYHFYVNENDAIYVTEPDPQYAIKVNESDVEDVVLLDLQNGDKAAFKFEYLPKGNVITIEKDGETLGTPYTTPRAGEYEFYVNSQEEISVVAPEVQYVIKLNGESQKGKEITNTDPNNAVVYKLENLAAGSIVVIEKDEETLYFYHSGKDNEDKPIDVKDDNQYTVEKLSNITFYVNKKGEVWTNVEVIAGDYKFVSSRTAINWDYEDGIELEEGSDDQLVLLEFELTKDEEFKLYNRKYWNGYSKLEAGCKALFTNNDDNIKVNETGKYNIYLKSDGSMWIEIIREHKFVSDSVGWNYANGVELTNDDANKPAGALHQWKLENQEMAAEEKFKLFDGNSSWLGYSSITDGEDYSWDDDSSGNIIIKNTGSYNIKLIETTKGNYSIILENNPETVSISVTVELDSGNTLAIAGDFNNWTPVALTKGSGNVWTKSISMHVGDQEYKLVILDGTNPDWDTLNSGNRSIKVASDNKAIEIVINSEPQVYEYTINLTDLAWLKNDGAKIFIYAWNNNGSTWFDVTNTTTSSKITFEAESGDWTKCQIIRKNPSGTSGNWNDIWNRTPDGQYISLSNCTGSAKNSNGGIING